MNVLNLSEMQEEMARLREPTVDDTTGKRTINIRGSDINLDKDDSDKMTEDMLAANPETLSVMSDFLRVDNLGTRVDKLTPKEITDKYIKRMYEIRESERHQLNTGMKLGRLLENEDNAAKLDIYEKAISLYENDVGGVIMRNESMWDVLSDMGHVLNQIMNPAQSPTMLIGPVAVKAGEMLGFKKVKKKIVKAGIVKASTLGLSKEQTKNFVRIHTGNTIKKKVGASIAVGTAAEVAALGGIDWLWQDSMMRIGQQEEYNPYQTAFASLSALLGTVVSYGSTLKTTGISGYNDNFVRDAKKALAKEPVNKENIHNTIKSAASKWLEKTQKGSKLLVDNDAASISSDFMKAIILGNDDEGFEGLVQAIRKEGLVYNVADLKKMQGTKGLADATTDLLLQLPDDVKADLFKVIKTSGALDEVKDNVVRRMNESGANKGIDDANFDDFIYVLTSKTKEAGQINNIWSQVSKKYAGAKNFIAQQKEVTEDVKSSLRDAEKNKKNIFKVGWNIASYIQNLFKRNVVSTWSTTSLNLKGFGIVTAVDTVSDIPRSATQLIIHAPQAAFHLLRGNNIKATQSMNRALSVMQNTSQRLKNTLDPNMTALMFKEFMKLDPEAAKQLNNLVAAGIEGGDTIEEMAKRYNFEINKTGVINKTGKLALRGAEAYTNFAQHAGLVTAADTFMKSQAYMGHLDSLMREQLGRSIKDLSDKTIFSPKERLDFLQSDDFLKLSREASDLTLETILSKSYKGSSGIGKIAGAIEDVGNIPLLGTYFPFGKFFNNTVAFTYNSLGGGYVNASMEIINTGKITARGQRKIVQSTVIPGVLYAPYAEGSVDKVLNILGVTEEDASQFLNMAEQKLQNGEVREAPDWEFTEDSLEADYLRGIVKYSAIAQCQERDMKKREMDMPWNMEMTSAGTMIDIQFDFPYSQCALLGRFLNLQDEGLAVKEMPREILGAMGEQFLYGQISRNFGKLKFSKIIESALDGDTVKLNNLIMSARPAAQTISGITRPFDASNQLSAYALGEEGEKLDINKSPNAWMAQSTRYLNNIFELISGKQLAVSDRDIAIEDVEATLNLNESNLYEQNALSRTMGIRARQPSTSTEQLLNSVDMESWSARIKSMFPEGELMFEEIVAPIIEPRAFLMLKNENFIDGTYQQKTEMVKKLLNQSKRIAMDRMMGGTKGVDGEKFAYISNILSANTKDKKEALKRENVPEDISSEDLLNLDMSTLLLINGNLPDRIYD